MENKQLLLGDVSGMSDLEVRQHIVSEFYLSESEIEPYDVLIADQDESGYDGDFYILLKNKENGNYYEVYGSHCSCYDYQGQFSPELAPIKYLISDFNGKYRNVEPIKSFLEEILK